MVIDTSALIAVIRKEPRWQRFIDRILTEPRPSISAASWVELGLVAIGRLHPGAAAEASQLRSDLLITIVPVDEAQAALAGDAFRRFGRGRHRAGLNFGDCFAYALAKARGEPLLFKGDDFGHTDIEPALSG
jgi:ribonuclease VapC